MKWIIKITIIKIFTLIGILGTLFAEELWKRSIYLVLLMMFYYLDCEMWFKGKFAKDERKEKRK